MAQSPGPPRQPIHPRLDAPQAEALAAEASLAQAEPDPGRRGGWKCVVDSIRLGRHAGDGLIYVVHLYWARKSLWGPDSMRAFVVEIDADTGRVVGIRRTHSSG